MPFKHALIITRDGEEVQPLTCDICPHPDNPTLCNLCTMLQPALPDRIHVQEILITRMSKKLMERWGAPIYAQG